MSERQITKLEQDAGLLFSTRVELDVLGFEATTEKSGRILAH